MNAKTFSGYGNQRTGVSTLETALSLAVFVTLILGMVDLGYGVFRQHVLSQATRQLARHAVVRGRLADRLTVWGPSPISVTADESGPVTEFIAAKLVGWELSDVKIELKWLDGDNDVLTGNRVKVAMSAPYRPIMTHIFGQPSITLSASSTMSVAH
jgi:Flp pilus assembly protein TadG